MKINLLFVMIGGFFGAISRYVLGEWIQTDTVFPLGTLLANLLGCFAMGWFLTFVGRRRIIRPELTVMIGTGFIGSFTTFSTFSMETIHLFQSDFILLGILYVLITIIVGLLLAYFGRKVALANRKEGDSL
ncbi:fluoride efflux transporter CrcB [Virgibacillus alimentarius]|uniref:fluoride efflux transporter CrcB n=1 Tax=Virgibacillus alimentarius TaxID=698769 RepID=UPI0004933884|nr:MULTISPECIES: fluoride efflux transporter CrcB [Virgibacillus]HLR69188.1 fluoride efflux transporter CrcB [Virgibacillus sp.]